MVSKKEIQEIQEARKDWLEEIAEDIGLYETYLSDKIYFTKIDTLNSFAVYILSEFNRELADKIVNAIPKQENDNTGNLFAIFDEVIHEVHS